MSRLAEHNGEHKSLKVRYFLIVLMLLEAGIFMQCLRSSLGWINQNFPGFLVIKNQIVAAAGCPFWQELRNHELLHARLEGIDGKSIHGARDAYDFIRSQPTDSAISYTLKSKTGEHFQINTVVHRFTATDFLSLFGVYMLNGLLFLAVGIICAWSWPRGSSTSGFLAVGILTSLWTFTACDLYGPYHFFRLHILAESLLPAAILHLALVFPNPPGIPKRINKLLLCIYSGFFAFGIGYEAMAFNDTIYPLCNRLATAGLGIALLAFLSRCVYAYFSANTESSKKGLRSLLFFALAALGPSVCVAISMALRGHPPVNYLGYSSFLLPLGLAAAAMHSKKKQGDASPFDNPFFMEHAEDLP